MNELAKILKDMQLAGSPNQTDMVYGVVVNLEPIEVRVDERFTIGTDFLEFSNQVMDISTDPGFPIFEVGDRLRMIKYSQGQKYYIVEVVDKEKETGVKDYEKLENLPVLDTTVSLPLSPEVETIKGNILLHKIAKTGRIQDASDFESYLLNLISQVTTPSVGEIKAYNINVNPNTIYPDTMWVRFAQGRTLVGVDESDPLFNTVGKLSGHKELQAHTHTASTAIENGGAHTHTFTTGSSGAHTHTATTNSTGAHTHTVSGTAASNGSHSHVVSGKVMMNNGAISGFGSALADSGYYRAQADNAVGTNSAGAHTHSVSGTAASAGAHSHTVTVASAGAHTHSGTTDSGGTHNHTATTTVNSAGGGDGGNIQPSIAVYYWVRTN